MATLQKADEELQERIRLAPGHLIAARIKEARQDANLSHDALGALCGGVSRAHLIKLEKARHRPRAPMLRKIAGATGRLPDWFLEDAGGRSPASAGPFLADGSPA
jgi:transcriptional regulator with XRE-family HTH domain